MSTVNCDEMAGDKPWQLAHEIFSIKRLISAVQVLTPYVQGGLRTRASKRDTPLKSDYFTAIGSCNVKTAADKYLLLIITSTGDRLFKFINIDDLEQPW